MESDSSKETFEECSICCEEIIISIECSFCKVKVCKPCVMKYLKGLQEDYKCLSCKKIWNYETILKLFNSKDVKTLIEHRRSILFDREKSQLPETQLIIEREQKIKQLENKGKELRKQLEKIRGQIHALRFSEVEGERREFIMACPVDDCRGFLSTRLICGLCGVKVCKFCREVKEEDDDDPHICNKDTVQSVKLMKKDTKPCPKCGTFIFRVSGCAQMWCIQCKTAFNWNTGAIITGNFHNPEYYDYIRNQGINIRENADNACGNEWRHIHFLNKFKKENSDLIFPIYNHIMHIIMEVIRRYQVNNRDYNLDIRKKYLLKEIDKKQFKTRLQVREKTREKKLAIFQILTTFETIIGDLLNQMTDKNILKIKKQLLKTLNLSQTYLNDLSKIYKCKVPNILFETIKN